MNLDLTTGKPFKVILKYSVPIVIGNIFQQVYNMVDTLIVGRFVNYRALAGVGITNGLTFLILGFVMGITSGLGICVAQYFGARHNEKLKKSIGTSIIISIIAAMVLTAISVLLCDSMLHMIDTGEEIFPYAHDYLIVTFWGISAQMAYNLVACILRALGDSKTPLYFLIFSSLLNVVLDYIFVVGLGAGVKGAAVATVIAQGVSAVLCFIYAIRHYECMRLMGRHFVLRWERSMEHLRMGMPMAVQFSIIGIGIIMLQAALNHFSPSYIAGFAAGNKIQNVAALTGVSLGIAISNYVGQNYGAGEYQRVIRGTKDTLWMAAAACVLSSTVMLLFAQPLVAVFVSAESSSDMQEILYAGKLYLYMSAIFLPALFLIFVARNAQQGLGCTFWPLMSGMLELVIRTVAALILPGLIGYWGIAWIDPLSWTGAALVLGISCYTAFRRKLIINPIQ